MTSPSDYEASRAAKDAILKREDARRVVDWKLKQEREDDRKLWRLAGGSGDPCPEDSPVPVVNCALDKRFIDSMGNGIVMPPLWKPMVPKELLDEAVVVSDLWKDKADRLQTRLNLFEQLARETTRFLPKHLRLLVQTAFDRKP
jgi:hypothetical protein